MSASQHRPPGLRPPAPARSTGPALAGLTLIIVAAGVAARRPAASGTGPWHSDALALAAATEAVLALLLTALWVLARRRPSPGYPAGLLRGALLRVIGLAMAAIAVLAGLSRVHAHPGSGQQTTPRPKPKLITPRHPPPVAGSSGSLSYILYTVLAVALAAAIVACVLALRRRVPAGPAARPPALPADDDENLRAAVESGRRALRSFDDAQAAIIACYAAMESSLARAGTRREAAETPDELLARATGSGLLTGSAAPRLTALFYEARYSSHPLSPAARDEALAALDAIGAELSQPAAASAAAAAPPAGAAP